MIHLDEIIMLILGLVLLRIISRKRNHLQSLPGAIWIYSSFTVLVLGWGSTVLEGLFAGTLLNYLEHALYSTSALLFAIWCYKLPGGDDASRRHP